MITNFESSSVKRIFTTLFCCPVVLVFMLAACANSGTQTTAPSNVQATAQPANHNGIAALDGYQVSLFASGTAAYTNPDSAVVANGNVFLDYQNNTAKDGTDNKTSTIVEYTMDGKVVKTFSGPGHSDGMRMDPKTKLLWVISNEDANPKMETIDPASGTITPYTFPTTPHGGGYDDVSFINGDAFISASNPTLDKKGNTSFPAVDKIVLSSGKATLTPILMGNASATDTTASANNAKVTLNEIDPDSLSTNANGDLVLVDQAGLEIVTITKPGTADQKVTRLATGSQLDDTVWATGATGRLLVIDGKKNSTYWLRTNFTPGTVYTETPDDSGMAGVVGKVNTSTGIISPVAIGFGKPTGLLFVPDTQS